ncbi:MAG TPA: pyridoxamine 5'-phosphate oxidase family protein [Acidimicrobiales bacterium]|nr:pyridoxamine 5'-phosphate oxidase family protein [Acidimicrobiales bacterium]
MGRLYDSVDGRLAEFITRQPVFFVATAPAGAEGHVNCSPKGNRDELVVLDDHTVAYLDLTGSGIETVAHLRDNGRIVLMFCSFEGPPRIVRLHGQGRVVTTDEPDFAELASHFPARMASRSVVVVSVTRVSDSCGYGVPLMSFQGHRSQMDEWAARKGPDGIVAYWEEKNLLSVDGLPGLATGPGSGRGSPDRAATAT